MSDVKLTTGDGKVIFEGTDAEFTEAVDKVSGKLGHNRKSRAGGIAVDQLKSIISRVENLEEQKSGIAADIKDIFAEAKGNGLDVKTIRKIIAIRKKDAGELEEEETILDLYMHSLGMIQVSMEFDEKE